MSSSGPTRLSTERLRCPTLCQPGAAQTVHRSLPLDEGSHGIQGEELRVLHNKPVRRKRGFAAVTRCIEILAQQRSLLVEDLDGKDFLRQGSIAVLRNNAIGP